MIFVKFPEPGRVKTRLAKSVGSEEAVRIYRALVARVASRVRKARQTVETNSRWAIWIVFDPPECRDQIREWLDPLLGSDDGVSYVPQVDGDLGARLSAAFTQGFGTGFDRVAAIGTDCVELGTAELSECWRQMDERDLVFGPAEDGGYYLIGMRSEHPELFIDIPWSSPRTLLASRAAATAAGLDFVELATLSDVDEIEQWHSLRESGEDEWPEG